MGSVGKNRKICEARKECHERLHITMTQSGNDPDDSLYIMDGYRDGIEETDELIPDERYEYIVP